MALDAVRAMKMECPQEGGTQYDYAPTELSPLQDALTAAGLYVQDTTASSADTAALIDRLGSSLRLTDLNTSHVLKELVSSTAGQVGSHNALQDVVHFLPDGPGDGWASGAVCTESYAGPLLTSAVWATDASGSKKIITQALTYAGPLVATAKWTLYAADGATVVRTLTDTYSYNGPLRTSRTRTWGTT